MRTGHTAFITSALTLGLCFGSSAIAQESQQQSPRGEGQPVVSLPRQDEGRGDSISFDETTQKTLAGRLRDAVKSTDGTEIVMLNHSVRLREQPPSGWLKVPGDESDVVSGEEAVILLDSQEVTTLFSTQNWYQVRRLCKDGVNCVASEGWIYGGKASDNLLVPFSDKALTRYIESHPDAASYFAVELGVPMAPEGLSSEVEGTSEDSGPGG